MTEAEFRTRMQLLGLEMSVTQSPFPRYAFYAVQVIRLRREDSPFPPEVLPDIIASALGCTDWGGTAEQARANVDWQGLYEDVCKKLQEDRP